MWNRKEAKARGKAAFQANYWYCVLVSFILSLFVGGGASVGGNVANIRGKDGESVDAIVDRLFGTNIDQEQAAVIGVVLIGILAIIGIAVLIGLVLQILVFSVLEVGGCRYYLENRYHNGKLDDLLSGFKNGNYSKVVITQFLRSLYTILWSFLFVIPGIIKAYSYSMVPYILTEDQYISGNEAITLSRNMMHGHKMDLFVLELSFIGWEILNVFTIGLLGIFYVNPYKDATRAEFYQAIKGNVNQS